LRELVRADAAAYGITSLGRLLSAVFGLSPFLLVLSHRAAHALHQRGIRLLPNLLRAAGHVIWGADIWPTAEIGPGFRIAHASGIVIGSAVEAGADLTVFSGAVLGGSAKLRPEWQSNQPRLGDRVMVSSHAVVAGGVHIGDDVLVGANAVVLEDVPAGHIVRSPTAEVAPRAPRT
jgi:serine O-acetyltransferase